MSDSRKEFEAWYVTAAFDYERNPIGSRECGLQWAAWQAARRAALEEAHEEAAKMAWHASRFMAFEEAAKVCESVDDGMGGQISAAAGWCADAIRALAAQAGQEGKL